jgi:hypothetical protein
LVFDLEGPDEVPIELGLALMFPPLSRPTVAPD